MVATDTVKPTYKVMSVEKIDTPEGMTGNNWHRYVIVRGKSEIKGMKSGTLNSVTQHAETMVEDLNLRSGGASTAYAARKRT